MMKAPQPEVVATASRQNPGETLRQAREQDMVNFLLDPTDKLNNALGQAVLARRLIQRLLDECKAEIKATGREEIVGTRAVVTLGLSERTTIANKLLKEILTAEQIEACSKTSLIETIRVKAIKTPQVLA